MNSLLQGAGNNSLTYPAWEVDLLCKVDFALNFCALCQGTMRLEGAVSGPASARSHLSKGVVSWPVERAK